MRQGIVAVLLLAGCGPGAEVREDPEPASASSLVSSLHAQVDGDSVQLTLAVSNAGAEAAVLEYATTQRYDFAVRDSSGAEIWRWSADQLFGQAVGADTLESGGTREYRASWYHGGRAGRYEATGELTSSDQSLELKTELEIPGR